ncbi:hypothetical protein Tco_1224883 [Tanacetum coccineum]
MQVVAISVILISSDSLDESVGSSPSRIILFGTIPAEIPAETPTIPSVVPTLPHTSPFLYTDSSDSRLASRYPPDHSSSDHFSSDVSSSDYSSDSSSDHSLPDYPVDVPITISVGPYRRRCRSSAVSVPLATPIPGALSLVRADLLPPCKRIRGYISASDYDDSTEESYEAYTEPDIDSDVQAGIDVDTTAVEAAAAREADDGVKVGIEIDREDKAE